MQLPDNSGYLILGLLILLLIAINLGLWAAWKRKNNAHKNEWLNALSKNFRNPWQREDEELKELSERVSILKKNYLSETNSSPENLVNVPKPPVEKP